MEKFNTIEAAVEDIKAGKMVIVVDDEDRENEGDFIMAAEKVTPEAVNFMISQGKGLVCVPMIDEDLNRLDIPIMVEDNSDQLQTAFTVSVDYRDTTTGISAYERALTIKKLTDRTTSAEDFKRPGHIFPLKVRRGGVLQRAGHTEAAIDLAKLGGLYPAGVICEIISEDGTMARLPALMGMAKKWDMKIISIEDLLKYRQKSENIVKDKIEVTLPTQFGVFKLHAFYNPDSMEPHLALVKDDGDDHKPWLVRIHSECFTGDVFGSQRCDCGNQLSSALEKIEQHGKGVLIYLRQEGRGIGLLNKLKAYKLQEEGYDTVDANIKLGFDAEMRNYAHAASMLKSLGIDKIKIMTNNPHKIADLKKNGIEISAREPLEMMPNCNNLDYLKTKQRKMGHLFKFELNRIKCQNDDIIDTDGGKND